MNPLISADDQGSDPPTATFHAVGGTPPYKWKNSNTDLGTIDAQGLPDIYQKAEYTLVGPIPALDPTSAALQDTITLLDADSNQTTATINVVFANCTLAVDETMVTLIGVSRK